MPDGWMAPGMCGEARRLRWRGLAPHPAPAEDSPRADGRAARRRGGRELRGGLGQGYDLACQTTRPRGGLAPV